MLNDLASPCADAWPVHDRYVFGDARCAKGIALCDHDFEALANVAPPGRRGWEGFFALYHLDHQPWTLAPWRIEDLPAFVGQLDLALIAFDGDDKTRANIDILMAFLKAKCVAGEAVYLEKR